MPELLVIRHGQSTWNAEHRWAGWADPPLSDAGRSGAAAFAATLDDLGISAVVTSDLQRAVQTGQIIAEHLGLAAPTLEPGLRERGGGAWTGKTTAEIDAEWPGWLDAWRSGEIVDPPGSEARSEFEHRIRETLLSLASNLPGRTLIVTHGGGVRTLSRQVGQEFHPAGNLEGVWISATAGKLVEATTTGAGLPPQRSSPFVGVRISNSTGPSRNHR